jgi:hypothetical protein
MSDNGNAVVQATDDLIKLYRGIDRRALDVSFITAIPFLHLFWAILKFEFFLVVGMFLIIPVNLVIFIRNLFPGRWKYRPFFLHHLRYVWLWVWRGEVPTGPFVLVRPLLNLFVRGHFESRLRRLRTELFLRDGLTDAERMATVGRIDAALEHWKTPRLATTFYTVLLPGLISIPGWWRQFVEFVQSLGVSVPATQVADLVSQSSGDLVFFGFLSLGYLLAFPTTAFLAKRGLFIGRDRSSICFPGGEAGCGAYADEREILARAGLRQREVPVDFWIFGIGIVLGILALTMTWDAYVDRLASLNLALDPALDPWDARDAVSRQMVGQLVVTYTALTALMIVAVARRGRTGRS